MYTRVAQKVRSIVNDSLETDGLELFTYIDSPVFKLGEPNATAANGFRINGNEPLSNESITLNAYNEVEITATLVDGDEIEVFYDYYKKYSDKDLADYIRAALVWISAYTDKQFELVTDGTNYEIIDTPDSKWENIIAMTAGILALPSYTQYKLGNEVTVSYPATTQAKELKIQQMLGKFKYGKGFQGLINMEAYRNYV